MNREAIISALFAKLSAIADFKTKGRRVEYWTQVADQPAIFLHHIGDNYVHAPTGIPSKVEMECQIWIYDNSGTSADAVPETNIHTLIEAVEAALVRPPGFQAQTLGGLVTHCWLDGRIDIHPGDAGSQAIAVMTLKILTPSFGG